MAGAPEMEHVVMGRSKTKVVKAFIACLVKGNESCYPRTTMNHTLLCGEADHLSNFGRF